MISSEIVRLPFDKAEVGVWAQSGDKRITNWPVVYILDDDTAKLSRTSDDGGESLFSEFFTDVHRMLFRGQDFQRPNLDPLGLRRGGIARLH